MGQWVIFRESLLPKEVVTTLQSLIQDQVHVVVNQTQNHAQRNS